MYTLDNDFSVLEYLDWHQVVLFVIFLLFYLISLLGKLGMITLIWMDSRPHTPMYFFVNHLSFVDVCSSSVLGPKMLTDIFVEKKLISFFGCATKLWLFGQFVVTECFLLASMAYDRCMAFCKPLLYTLIMSRWVCVQLLVGPYTMGLLSSMTHTTFAFLLAYCGPNIINHFFCDMSPLLSLVCANIQVNKFLVFIVSGAIVVISSPTIIISYFYILITILRIHSAEGRCKASSTCSSNITAVSILYGTLFCIYVRLGTIFSLDFNKKVTMFYTIVIPMLNSFIYSLRNKEVKATMHRMVTRRKFCITS
nr:PREDICTED: olfactory receptor 1009-like [Equus przewalskii]